MEIKFVLITIALSFVLTAIIGPFVLKWLRWLKAGQSIREEGPQSHQAKSGTPTMGGVMIILGVIIASVIMRRGITADLAVLVVSFLLFALIGFCDDFVKVAKKRNLGLTAKQKFLFQLVIAVIVAVYQAQTSDFGTSIYIPIVKTYFDLSFVYYPFVVFVMVAMVNAVNLTDGLDGLAGGITALVALFLASQSLVFGSADTTVFTAALVGGCLGFLIFNHHPAKVFMGDTGSLALGGALATAAVMMHIEMILVVAGAVFVAECLSVIIQVAYFKKTGKRVFRMAPLHHHFELGGWKETKVVAVFWATTLVLCAISMLIL